MPKPLKINFDKPKQIIGSFIKPKSQPKLINNPFARKSDQIIGNSIIEPNSDPNIKLPITAVEDIVVKPVERTFERPVDKPLERPIVKPAVKPIETKKITREDLTVNNPIDFFKSKPKKVENRQTFTVDQDKTLLITTKSDQDNTLNIDVGETTFIPIKKWNDFLQVPIYYVAFITALVSGGLFFYTALQEKASAIGVPNIKLENLIIFTSLCLTVLDIIFVYLMPKRSLTKSLHIFFALITLQISAFLYSLKIYGTELFKVGPIMVTTSIVIPILAIIIFLQALDIIQNKNRMWVNIAQVFVILNQLFSTVKLFDENSFSKKNFGSSIFNTIFDFPPFVFVMFATIALAILSTYNLKQGLTRFIFVVGMMFPILNLLLYTRASTYWYQTIMALIVWDMIYNPMFEAEKEHTDKNVMARLMVSSVYHLALFVLVLVFNTVLNFIIVKP